MNAETGTVLCGANNIFTVRPSLSAEPLECRIKGKILRNAGGDYNPLAPGDTVSFLRGAEESACGVLLERGPRKNALLRWNKKGRAAQTIAANVDLIVCVSSPASPPFRPRFLDRLLIAAGLAGIPGLICLNKTDQALTDEDQERLDDFAARGIPVLRTRLDEGNFAEGEEALRQALRGKRVVFAGQSGGGKTSLLNALAGENRKTGEISEKYNRGRHTTVLAFLAAWEEGEIIDTPGVREFEICGADTEDLRFLFAEFAAFAAGCRLGGGCTHTHEPDCAVRAAAEEGSILFDRYASYRRIYDEFLARKRRSHE
ncbi:MAG: ribosome small subunit-dependent GTPase A [Spirochaetaceae bacterium]|nr:ribosome small subunit-dependent GTPase A [Spirochaetaceae bacterium]